MDVEKELRALRRVVRIQGGVLLLAILWAAGSTVLSRAHEMTHQVSVSRTGNAVSISSPSDGPFLITHLTVRGAESESDKKTAALPQPTACVDSRGLHIEDISKLDWRDLSGQPTPPPGPSVQITALVLRPEYAELSYPR